MRLDKANRFMCISLGVTFGDHAKIAKKHFRTHFLEPWTPEHLMKFDVLYRAVSLRYYYVPLKVWSLPGICKTHFRGLE